MCSIPSGGLRSGLTSVVLVLVITPAAAAQFRAGVQGTVRASTGEPLPRVAVVVINHETGRADDTVTSKHGVYFISGLPPGTYNVTAKLAGFKTHVVNDVVVHAETAGLLDLTLESGDVTETIVANANGPALPTESGSVAGTISEIPVRRLPQFGRDPYELVRLAPGVFGSGARSADGNASSFPRTDGFASFGFPNNVGPGGSNLSIFQTQNQVQISANGQRISANNFTIDGVSANSLDHGGAAVVTPNQESVKAITVVASSYSAEDGRNSGALIKVVSQSGTNMPHGSALFKYNDPVLNSRNKYGGPNNEPRVKVEQRFRQYAGSLGGPILRDKLFFFGSFEGLRNNMSQVANAWVETPEFRELVQRLRPNGVSASILGASGIEPRIRTVLPADCAAFQGLPCQMAPGGLDFGSPTGSLGTRTFIQGPLDGIPDMRFVQIELPHLVRAAQYNARLDYQQGNNRYAVSTYFTKRDDESSDPSAQGRPMADLVFAPLSSAGTVIYNRVLSPTLLNESRFNVTSLSADQVESSKDTDFGIPRVSVSTYLMTTRAHGNSVIDVPVYPFGGPLGFGAPRGDNSLAVFSQRTYEVRNIVTKIFGKQSVKVGGEMRWEQDNNSLVGAARPLYSFGQLWNFANDAFSDEYINADPRTGSPADVQRHFRTSYYGVFVQDDWKLRPNLTLNLGLRYEYFTPLTERDGFLTNLQLGSRGLADARVVSVSRFYDPDRNNFAPRVGVAWNPQRFSNKLVLRGGFGVSYNRLPLALFTNARGNPPSLVRDVYLTDLSARYVRGSSRLPRSFPPNSARAVGIDPGTGGLAFYQWQPIWGAPPKLPNPYVYHCSLEGQFQLARQLVGSVGYTGSASHKLIRLVQNDAFFEPDQLNPHFPVVFFAKPDIEAHYNAGELRLARAFADGFTLEGSYRLSKSVDTRSYEMFRPPSHFSDPTNPKPEEGRSDYDVRHSFVLAGAWDLPFARGRHDMVGRIAGGWHVSGILTAHSGFPWTATIFDDHILPTRQVRQGTQNPSNQDFIDGIFPDGGTAYFEYLFKLGHPFPGPAWIGRNSQRGPRYLSADFTLGKRTTLMGRADVELRANLFNLFNTLNLRPFGLFSPGTFIHHPNLGRVEGALAGRVAELQARFSF